MDQQAAVADRTELLKAIESQDQFMSFVSHEVRGGLNGIVLMLEVIRRDLIKRGGDFSETMNDIETLRKAVHKTVAMMDRAMLADRIRRGRIEPHLETVNLRKLVDEAIGNIAHTHNGKALGIENEVPSGGNVTTDSMLLVKAVSELLDNAVRAGEGSARVTAARTAKSWEISIADRGQGIEAMQLRRLIDPSRRPSARDKGLGLVTANQIVRLLGGRLDAESAPGHGSTFRLILPDSERA